jgi:hypothetical protein
MVPEGSEDLRVAQSLQATAAKLGWNMKVQSYAPIDIRFHTAYQFWDEAWQRVILYNMSGRFDRVLHVDADAYAFQNVEHILRDGVVPSAARRQGPCSDLSRLCTKQPVSNFMLITPNATIWKQIFGSIDVLNKLSKEEFAKVRNKEETMQFDFHRHVNLLSPSDVTYFDCFKVMSDDTLTAYGYNLRHLPSIVHLGIQFKEKVSHIEKHRLNGAAADRLFESQFQRTIWDRTKRLAASTDVQEMVNVLNLRRQRRLSSKSSESTSSSSNICD